MSKSQKQGCSTLKDVLSCGLAGCFKVSARAGAVVYLFSPWRSAKSGGAQSSFQSASNGLLVAFWSVVCLLTCASRAPSLRILIFCFHNLHRRVAFTVKIPCFVSGSWMEEFPNFWALVEHLLVMFSVCLTNFVPNRALIVWFWLNYREFCEGCESKKLKIAVGARVHAREGILFRFPDVGWTPSFFLLDFRERFLVSLALELPCVIVMLNEKY